MRYRRWLGPCARESCDSADAHGSLCRDAKAPIRHAVQGEPVGSRERWNDRQAHGGCDWVRIRQDGVYQWRACAQRICPDAPGQMVVLLDYLQPDPNVRRRRAVGGSARQCLPLACGMARCGEGQPQTNVQADGLNESGLAQNSDLYVAAAPMTRSRSAGSKSPVRA